MREVRELRIIDTIVVASLVDAYTRYAIDADAPIFRFTPIFGEKLLSSSIRPNRVEIDEGGGHGLWR
ncbi:hypothetical protein ASD52_25975 [Ensifer sp. Root142]|jgi:hypothetical protein|nr:hypothetical protein ASD03_32715 [Ensifer sp. Root127]KQY73890.1 hypothetical protein ASD52_25975 [Ensifer sp. Root142]